MSSSFPWFTIVSVVLATLATHYWVSRRRARAARKEAARKHAPASPPFGEPDPGIMALTHLARVQDDVGYDYLMLKRQGEPTLFGEWELASSGSGDFHVEITGFGYTDGYLGGARGNRDRKAFTLGERRVIEHVIRTQLRNLAPHAPIPSSPRRPSASAPSSRSRPAGSGRSRPQPRFTPRVRSALPISREPPRITPRSRTAGWPAASSTTASTV